MKKPPAAAESTWQERWLWAPVDNASLIFLRGSFGALMAWHMLSYFWTGTYESQYVEPVFHFTYPFFEWVKVGPPWLMKGLLIALALAGIAIALGRHHRVAALFFSIGHTYLWLTDTTFFLNHVYLISLLALLLAVVPLDARVQKIPAWALNLIRFQLAVPYVFGGLNKLNADWLGRAEPLHTWIRQGLDQGFTIPFAWQEEAAYFLSWSGMLFDLLVVPGLLFAKTRKIAFVLVLFFNLSNSQLFTIGIFPWMMIACSTIFFPADWPARFLRKSGGTAKKKPEPAAEVEPLTRPAHRQAWMLVLATYVLIQLLLPYRHLLYPGDVDWTEQGHRFAWRMKLRDKAGTLAFSAIDPVTQRVISVASAQDALTRFQQRMMLHDPEMIRQYSTYLAGVLRQAGYGDVDVHVSNKLSLNGRPAQEMVRSKVALSRIERDRPVNEWIVPLEPLSP